MNKYRKYDYIPDSIKDDPRDVPKGYDFWPGEKIQQRVDKAMEDLEKEQDKLEQAKKDLEKEKKDHAKVEELSCADCDFKAKTERGLKIHRSSKHEQKG